MASILKIDQLQEKTVGHGINLQHSLNNSSGNEIISAAGALSGNVDLSGAVFPAGHIIKIEQTIVGGAQTVTTGNSWGDAISVSIQTTKANSKILVIPNVYFGLFYQEGYQGAARIIRDYPTANTLAIGSTTINSNANSVGHYHISDSNSTRWQQSMALTIRDTPNAPAGTTIQYKVQAQIVNGNGGEAIYINRWALNPDFNGISILTVMEIS